MYLTEYSDTSRQRPGIVTSFITECITAMLADLEIVCFVLNDKMKTENYANIYSGSYFYFLGQILFNLMCFRPLGHGELQNLERVNYLFKVSQKYIFVSFYLTFFN